MEVEVEVEEEEEEEEEEKVVDDDALEYVPTAL